METIFYLFILFLKVYFALVIIKIVLVLPVLFQIYMMISRSLNKPWFNLGGLLAFSAGMMVFVLHVTLAVVPLVITERSRFFISPSLSDAAKMMGWQLPEK